MLVISRNVHESFQVTTPDGTVLDFIVSSIRGDKVSIGIDAPRNFTVTRPDMKVGVPMKEISPASEVTEKRRNSMVIERIKQR